MTREPDSHLEVTFRAIPYGGEGWGPDSGWWTLEQFDAGDLQAGGNFHAVIISCVCGGRASGFRDPRTCPRWHRHRVVTLAKTIASGSVSWFLAGPAHPPRFGYAPTTPMIPARSRGCATSWRYWQTPTSEKSSTPAPPESGWAKRTRRVITLTDTGRAFLASLGIDPDTGKPLHAG